MERPTPRIAPLDEKLVIEAEPVLFRMGLALPGGGAFPEPTPPRMRLTSAPLLMTVPLDDVRLLLMSAATREHTPEAVHQREMAGVPEIGKQITWTYPNESVTYAIEDEDGYVALLRRLS